MKKLIKRILLGLLVAILLLQIPFIYRRYENGKIAEKITQLQSQRTIREDPLFNEYKGIIHAHTSLGGHSTGGFDELIAAANKNDLDFVLMTEHYTDLYDTAAMTLNGLHGKTLFIGGNEIDTADGDRFLMIPGGADAAGFRNLPTNEVLNRIHAENGLAFITYPEKFKSWDSNFDGDEVFSLHTEASHMNPFTTLFDLIWTYPAYPDLMLATYFKRPDANLQKFDEIAAKRKISLFPGSDAHSNIGFHLFGDDAGHKILNIKIDPYETIFRIARVHVLVERSKPLNRENLIEALKNGHFFTGLDILGDTTGFSFTTEHGNEAGDEVKMSAGLKLKASAPANARFVFFRNGEKITETGDTQAAEVDAAGPGVYRVEAYLDQLGSPFDKMPWIMSNPIYVR